MAKIGSEDAEGGVAVPHWSSRFAFIMAAVGSAVGLGNIWKFPYMTGTGGGAAFVLFYLGCVLVVGVPVLVAELMLGRRAQRGPIGALVALGRRYGGTPAWGLVAGLGVVAAFLILSFYSVIAGWALAYIPKLAVGAFAGASAQATGAIFDGLLADPLAMAGWHTLFMALTVVIVAQGVTGGIERAVTLLTPALFVMLVILAIYASVTGDFARGMAFLFTPDFSKLTTEVAISAAGQAFFSLSIGLGTMLAYGAYVGDNVSLPKMTLTIAAADTTCAMVAGVAIFPIVFASGLDPAGGPGLVFVTLPVAFGAMPFGSLFGGVFFVLLAVAAVTSSVSLLEPIVASLQERVRLPRIVLALGVAFLSWVLGFLTIFSFNRWSDIHPLGGGRTFFDLIDYATTNIMLPLGGVLLAVFAGWVLTREARVEEFGMGEGVVYRVWLFLVRFLAPAVIVIVALDALF